MNQLEIFRNREFGDIRTVTEGKKVFQRSELATLENHIPQSVLNVKFVDVNLSTAIHFRLIWKNRYRNITHR